MKIFDIKPIILGGDPKDPKNKTLLNREKHIEIVNYWNNIIHDLKRGKRPEGLSTMGTWNEQ